MSVQTMERLEATANALRVALESLLCIDCGYRIGFTERHGTLGAGNPGIADDHRYKDWRDCATCRFAREVLTDQESIGVS